MRFSAHPRRCGDHSVLCLLLLIAMGSSPQVRGPRGLPNADNDTSRLIPAGAGTTIGAGFTLRVSGAHPRRCGDHKSSLLGSGAGTGSSPQVRGPPSLMTMMVMILGLIPAGAGTTACLLPPPCVLAAHPRRCGDHTPPDLPLVPSVGSSPQVRGPRMGLMTPP